MMPGIKLLALTEYQLVILIKILKNYKKLRKSHFWQTQSGLKQQKITDELVLVDGLIVYFEGLL